MNKIACMIVTYNRCELLKLCLDALDNQTCQDFDILVLNNGSEDNTRSYIEQRKLITTKNLMLVNVEKNKGMAYGYNRGYAAVFERGYDWIWTMDDDGLPEMHQLETLLNAQKETGLLYLNALVCDIEDHRNLAFDINGKIRICDIDGSIVNGIVKPDNGTLINRSIYENCGNIKSELISYGMETEFVERIKKHGYKVATITSAIHYHPIKESKLTYVINLGNFRKIPVYSLEFMGYERYWQYVKSLGYICGEYRDNNVVMKTCIRNMLYFLLRFRFYNMVKWLYIFNKGRANKFRAIG